MKKNQPLIERIPLDVCGATAIEFAIVAPVFLTVVIGMIQLSFLAFTIASLNYAVEKGARCAAVQTGCPGPESHYHGPGPTPTFTTSESAACGVSVTASVTYNLNVLAYRKAIPLSGSACFPNLKSGA